MVINILLRNFGKIFRLEKNMRFDLEYGFNNESLLKFE